MTIDSGVADGDGAHDALSAGFSRKTFIREMSRAKARADRDATGFVLCLIDVDQLRNINDRHGQSAGDAVLLGVRRHALQVLDLPDWRNIECLQARFDGDSFILLLPRCRLRDGEQLAEELRRRCAGGVFERGLRITVSIAVTAYRSGESVDALLARTERTLHLAKQFGCDRVETAWTPEARLDRAGRPGVTELTGADRATRPRPR